MATDNEKALLFHLVLGNAGLCTIDVKPLDEFHALSPKETLAFAEEAAEKMIEAHIANRVRVNRRAILARNAKGIEYSIEEAQLMFQPVKKDTLVQDLTELFCE